MDYKEFFNDVSIWVIACNERAEKFGLNSEKFWAWVADTIGRLCDKYDNHPLAVAQSQMLWDWLKS